MTRRVGRPYNNLKSYDEYRKQSQKIAKRIRRVEELGDLGGQQAPKAYRKLMDEINEYGGFSKGSERDRARWSTRIDQIDAMQTSKVSGSKKAYKNQVELFSDSVDGKDKSARDRFKELSDDQRSALWKAVGRAYKEATDGSVGSWSSDQLVSNVEAMLELNFDDLTYGMDPNNPGKIILTNEISFNATFDLEQDVMELRRENKAIELKGKKMQPKRLVGRKMFH